MFSCRSNNIKIIVTGKASPPELISKRSVRMEERLRIENRSYAWNAKRTRTTRPSERSVASLNYELLN